MTDMEAIRLRRSRRSYSGPLEAAKADALREMAQSISEETGLLIRLMEDSGDMFGGFSKSYGMFKGVNSFFVLAGDENDENLLEKAGYYGQKLVLHATKLGYGTCWVGGTFDRHTIAYTLAEGQRLVGVITVGPTPEKQPFRERLIYSVARRSGKKPEEMFTAQGEAPAWFLEGVRAAAKAPSAINRQPVHFKWDGKAATAAVADNSSYERIDLGVAKLHFELAACGKFALGNGANFTKNEET